MARNRSAGVVSSLRFAFGLALVTVGAGVFAVAFRASLTALYEHLYGAENVVDSIASLPAWMRLGVPLAAAALAGTIARLRSSHAHGVSNVMEAIALGQTNPELRQFAIDYGTSHKR